MFLLKYQPVQNPIYTTQPPTDNSVRRRKEGIGFIILRDLRGNFIKE